VLQHEEGGVGELVHSELVGRELPFTHSIFDEDEDEDDEDDGGGGFFPVISDGLVWSGL
jgi:hypothetical protein